MESELRIKQQQIPSLALRCASLTLQLETLRGQARAKGITLDDEEDSTERDLLSEQVDDFLSQIMNKVEMKSGEIIGKPAVDDELSASLRQMELELEEERSKLTSGIADSGSVLEKLEKLHVQNVALASTELVRQAKIAGLEAEIKVFQGGLSKVEQMVEGNENRAGLLTEQLKLLQQKRDLANSQLAESYKKVQDFQIQVKKLQVSQLESKDRTKKADQMLLKVKDTLAVLQKQKLMADLEIKKKEEEITRLRDLESVLQKNQLSVRDRQKSMDQQISQRNSEMTKIQLQQLQIQDKVAETASKLEQRNVPESPAKAGGPPPPPPPAAPSKPDEAKAGGPPPPPPPAAPSKPDEAKAGGPPPPPPPAAPSKPEAKSTA